MKQTIVATLAACVATFGRHLFELKADGPFYFQVKSGINKVSFSEAKYLNSQVVYIANLYDADCNSFWDYACVVTFSTDVLTSGHQNISGNVAIQARSTVLTRGVE